MARPLLVRATTSNDEDGVAHALEELSVPG